MIPSTSFIIFTQVAFHEKRFFLKSYLYLILISTFNYGIIINIILSKCRKTWANLKNSTDLKKKKPGKILVQKYFFLNYKINNKYNY